MGGNAYDAGGGGSARGPLQERRAERKKAEEEVFLAGKNLGYHLGYSLGFESGFEKGYAEGSTFGYNNGFLAALKLGEGEPPSSEKPPEIYFCRALQKLVAGGLARVFLAGCAAREAEALFKILNISVAVLDKEINI
ncbi:hypothetical protein PTH_0086 [Pelotomaculum thermopropionicum SI]|uniref:Essential protein Yae1 N-terminal domain-containing protein n=1 Tax=Pelotomaculum thermopropionicum (strain DSM 13744 / JCM 10971 / SI) TaxID=370438 RepID=A5D679_PELTS|nr:hypothetical protein PTH_0086 [Pelotomaculum thermopropionicum SI]